QPATVHPQFLHNTTDDTSDGHIAFVTENITQCLLDESHLSFHAYAGEILYEKVDLSVINPTIYKNAWMRCYVTFTLPPQTVALFQLLEDPVSVEVVLEVRDVSTGRWSI
ncbi:hypothetical protein BaRGS_00034082, partial [Batillaria attramentaria]